MLYLRDECFIYFATRSLKRTPVKLRIDILFTLLRDFSVERVKLRTDTIHDSLSLQTRQIELTRELKFSRGTTTCG